MPGVQLLQGDCLEVLKGLTSASVDAIVTDPPAGISFMGKDWDHDKGGRLSWVQWMTNVMSECLRVVKPGGHALVWALPRTSHWTAWAMESAGFQIRDCVYHAFGSGFPKSMDVSKAFDRVAGVERPVVGTKKAGIGSGKTYAFHDDNGGASQDVPVTVPVTDEAVRWDGWGTALKPAVECWWLGRRPLDSLGASLGLPIDDEHRPALRLAYTAKAQKTDRDEGLDAFEERAAGGMAGRNDGSLGKITMSRNVHPTVKPVDLMRYLCWLVTPQGGQVLDPFMGSGSTGKGAILEGFGFVGIERDPEYFSIAEARLRWTREQKENDLCLQL